MVAVEQILKRMEDGASEVKKRIEDNFEPPLGECMISNTFTLQFWTITVGSYISKTGTALEKISNAKEQLNDYASVIIALTTLRTPQCMEDMITSLLSFDPYQLMEHVDGVIAEVGSFVTGVSNFFANNSIWRTFIDGFTTLLNNVSQFLLNVMTCSRLGAAAHMLFWNRLCTHRMSLSFSKQI